MKRPKITLIQMKIRKSQKQKNLDHALKLIDENKDSDFVCLPEEFLCGFDYSKTDVETIPGNVTEELCKKAKENNLIIISSFIEKKADKYYVSSPVIGPKGIMGVYRKMHNYMIEKPIKTMEGKKYLTNGKEIKIFDSNFGKFSVAICKDMYYPELFRAMRIQGAKMVFVSAYNWAPEFFEHMACSRALENEMFICLVNTWGLKENQGQSLVVRPYKKLIKAEEGEMVIKTSINLNRSYIGGEKIFSDIKYKLYGLGKYYK